MKKRRRKVVRRRIITRRFIDEIDAWMAGQPENE